MRQTLLFSLLVFAVPIFAQDTNFPLGPQYLANGPSLFLRPIATPSLSFSSEIPSTYTETLEVAPSRIPSPMALTLTNVFLGEVYWGEHPAAEIVARRLDTPTLTADQTAYFTHATATETMHLPNPPTVPVEPVGSVSVIEITSAELPANLPESIFNPGVLASADPQWLIIHGYAMSLADLARYWKSHKRPAAHVFTNEDIERNK